MAETKMMTRFYTVADFTEEENWLMEEHRNGWRLEKMIPPCFYTFERCEPEEVIYRLDFKNNQVGSDYMRMVEDFGWEYIGSCFGWLYFRKPASEVTTENEGELFSDTESKIEHLDHIMKTRLTPLAVIFLCCVIPNGTRALEGGEGAGFVIFWLVMFAIYLYLLTHCGFKLRKMKRELEMNSER